MRLKWWEFENTTLDFCAFPASGFNMAVVSDQGFNMAVVSDQGFNMVVVDTFFLCLNVTDSQTR